jgi:hypothetical protein
MTPRRPPRNLVPFVFLCAAVLLACPASPDTGTTIRGITLSTHTNGGDWAGPGVCPAVADMEALGADWVAIHPYAGIQGDGTVRHWRLDPEAPPDWLTHPIREAHDHGLKILIKPHLAYWGTEFSWRGDIQFDAPASRRRFWDGYREWIVILAAACRGADGFVVGTELDRMLHHEAEWRELIAAVRAVTDMPVTYAANWSDYRQVPFWDAVDVIGIQAYFPVADSTNMSAAVIEAGWDRRMEELREFSRAQNRYIVFTELGYNRNHHAPTAPWAYPIDGEDAEAVQALCLRLALEAVEREPAVIGSFLWKWFPDPYPVGRNFQLATPLLRRTIHGVWGSGGASDRAPG